MSKDKKIPANTTGHVWDGDLRELIIRCPPGGYGVITRPLCSQ